MKLCSSDARSKGQPWPLLLREGREVEAPTCSVPTHRRTERRTGCVTRKNGSRRFATARYQQGSDARSVSTTVLERIERASLEGRGGGLVVLLLAEQRRGWRLMIFCARATRGLRRPSLDARSGDQLAPIPEERTSKLGWVICNLVRRPHSRIDLATP
jgi:hypothetical protein